jgi:hypothetical protein
MNQQRAVATLASLEAKAVPMLRIEPSRGSVSLKLHELWEYRELLSPVLDVCLACGLPGQPGAGEAAATVRSNPPSTLAELNVSFRGCSSPVAASTRLGTFRGMWNHSDDEHSGGELPV